LTELEQKVQGYQIIFFIYKLYFLIKKKSSFFSIQNKHT